LAVDRVLTVNAGSSSLKLSLLDAGSDQPVWSAESNLEDLPKAMRNVEGIDAVGHRIVHGGQHFRDAVRIDQKVRDALEKLTDLAPLHQPKSLAALDAVSRLCPDVPAVACFDTAFHAGLSPAAYEYALPAEWRERWGVRRYGFHGLSHAYIARHVAERLGRDDLRIVSCHLGAGASLCAISHGRSVDTTMGFTPLEGVVMATRSGSVDPGLLLWLLERTGLSGHQLEHVLEHESGLLGLAGSADMREVLAARAAGNHRAGIAIDVYIHRLRAGIAAMVAAIGGIDALAFTGGVGENAAQIRQEACAGLGFLGVGPAGPTPVLCVPAREDLEIATQTRAALSRP
jgi:acetate kinase